MKFPSDVETLCQNDAEIHEKVGEITQQFDFLDCLGCAKAVRWWLRKQNISGTLLRLRTRYGEDYILSDRLQQQGITDAITVNGQHFGVEVRGKVFDNLSREGLLREDWLQDFSCHSGEFIITELDQW